MKTFYDYLNLSATATQEEIEECCEHLPDDADINEFYDIYFYLYDERNREEYDILLKEESDSVVDEFHSFLNHEAREVEEKYSINIAKSDNIISKALSLQEKLTSQMGYLHYFLGEAYWHRDQDELALNHFQKYLELYPDDWEVKSICENQSYYDMKERSEKEAFITDEIKRRPKAVDLILQLAKHHFEYREYAKAEALLDEKISEFDYTMETASNWVSLSVLRAGFFYKRGNVESYEQTLQDIFTKVEMSKPFPNGAVSGIVSFLKQENDHEWEIKFQNLFEKHTSVKKQNTIAILLITFLFITMVIFLQFNK